jgi:uncharacterized metal-binding protein
MPNHKTHDRAALIATPIVFIVIGVAYSYVYAILVTVSFLFGNFYLSPDLDTRSIMVKRWGFLYWVWKPYVDVIPHRSFWSHSGFISAGIRVLYLFGILTPLLIYLPTIPLVYIFILFIGVSLADILHVSLDVISTGYKKVRRYLRGL